jgi:hypothetical protein
MIRYGYADVGRFGLGHGLLAWARCIIWCHDNGATAIAPNWIRPRVGPILRNERDKRLYFMLFSRGEQLSGLKRLKLLLGAPRISAQGPPDAVSALPDTVPMPDGALAAGHIMVFANSPSQNEAKFFHQIYGRHDLVRVALIKMTKPRHRPRPLDYPHVAIHVRGGDFGLAATPDLLKSGQHNLRLPESWYVEILQGLREKLGRSLPAIVYSDCLDEELSLILGLADVARAPRQQSITDMLSMSEATVMISSGSGFSRWGAYLGQVPRVCYPGQRSVRVLFADGSNGNAVELEPEAESPSEISCNFVAEVARRIGEVT